MLRSVSSGNIVVGIIWTLVTVTTIKKVNSLQCWKCIAHDCESNPEDNYKAIKVECTHGEMCMKVQYKMFDNTTHYDSVVRTCSGRQCVRSTEAEFMTCINTPKHYMIGGCTLRSCCNDKDLCNRSTRIDMSWIVLLNVISLLKFCA